MKHIIKITHHVKLGLLTIFLVTFLATATNAATYYVRTDGDNSNNGLTNSSDGAWKTIDYAADNVSAGDVVRVQAGTYEERVTPGVDGSSVSNTVTFVADGSVTMCGWDLNSNDYLRVIGFTIDTDAGSCSKRNGGVYAYGDSNDYLEFWNNTFRDANYNGIRSGTSGVLKNSLIIGNTFYNFGVGNGSGMAVSTRGNENLIAYNEVYNSAPDGFLMYGSRNRWVGNYVHGLNESYGGHADLFQVGSNSYGWANNLIEGTFYVAAGNQGDEHVAQISHAQGYGGDMTENIFRRNVWHNVSQGTIGINQTNSGPITHTRIYNNTTAEAAENSPSNRNGLAIYGSQTSDTFVHNNIEYESWGNSATSNLIVYYVTGGLTSDYNLAYDPQGNVTFSAPFATQSNGQGNANPQFVDYNNDDFHIQSNSGAIGNAGPLTQVNEPSDTSGTSFNVDDAGFFRGDNTNLSQYGGNLIVGDTITVGNDTVRISSISGNTITVTESFTWADRENVYFGDDNTPDIGAYPYKSGGYALNATYINSSGTVRVTPNDADLVRMVVVFEDGIPISADSTSPYTVSGVGSGSLEVRVYPLYASKSLYVSASEIGNGQQQVPSPPQNLRIVY